MKKRIVLFALAAFLLLPGCAQKGPPKETREIAKIRQTIEKATGYEAKLNLTLSYPNQSSSFRLKALYSKEGKSTVAIEEPEEMAGFWAELTGDKVLLYYDGEPYDDGGGMNKLPVSLLRLLFEVPFVQQGKEAAKEKGDTALFEWEESSPLGPIACKLTVDKENSLPLEGEFSAPFLAGKAEFLQFAYLNENSKTTETEK